MTLTAIISRNFRDTATGAPKVLLRGIQTPDEEYRDHAWVELTVELRRVVDRITNNRSLIITLEAEMKEYTYRPGIVKRTLTNVSNVKVVGRA